MRDFNIETITNEEARHLNGQAITTTEDEIGMKVDVERVLKSLDPALREICRSLAAGRSKTRIAAELNKSRAALEKDLLKIRQEFQRHGLEVYLED